jgi:hypothetical protein
MTAKEAKEKTLYFWRYIAAHPEIRRKLPLPKEMVSEMAGYLGMCPLCDYGGTFLALVNAVTVFWEIVMKKIVFTRDGIKPKPTKNASRPPMNWLQG